MLLTSQKLCDEDALIKSCFFNMEEEVIEHERRSARMHLRRYDLACREIHELVHLAETLSVIRQAEDNEILDVVITTQQLLQKTVTKTRLIQMIC